LKTLKVILLPLSCLCFAANCFGQNLSDYMNFIAKWEGLSLTAYDDCGAYAVGYGRRVNSKMTITHMQAKRWLAEDTSTALEDARKLVPGFDSKHSCVKLIVVDMSYNLGYNRMKKFVKFLNACAKNDYLEMAKELEDSLWFHQVGRRSRNHVNSLKLLGN
jgi:lysozyme